MLSAVKNWVRQATSYVDQFVVRQEQSQQEPSINGVCVTLSELIALRYVGESLDVLHGHRKASSQLLGDHHSNLRGRGMDFDEVRIYQAGDDIRNMDWQVTARTGKPHTKLFHEERERPVFVVVDQSPTMFFATRGAFKSAIAARIAAILGWAVIKNSDRLGAIVFSGTTHSELKPRTRKHGILPLLKILSDFKQPTAIRPQPKTFGLALKRLRQVARPGSLVFVISDFSDFDYEAERHLTMLSRHSEVVAIQITDPLEAELPPPDYYEISNGDDVIAMNTTSAKFRLDYRFQFDKHQEHVSQFLTTRAIPLIKINTYDDVAKSLSRQLGGEDE